MREKCRFQSIISNILIFCILILSMMPLYQASAYTVVEGQRVYDDAGLLTSDEINKITTQIKEVEEKSETDLEIYLLTTNDDQGYSSDDYIEYFFDEGHNIEKIFKENSIIILFNMDYRDVCLNAYGACEDTFLGSPTKDVTDSAASHLGDYEYYEACKGAIEDIDYYLNATPIFYHTWFQLLVACALGAIIVAIMAFTRGTPITTNDNTYLDQHNSRLRFHHDNYIRTVVTKVKKPQNNSNGGGGTHHSGGPSGHSHSSGSSRF